VTSSTTSVCTVSGAVVNFVGLGTFTLTPQASAGVNYKAVVGSPQSFSVGKRSSALLLTGPSQIPFGTCSSTFTAVLTDLLSSAPLPGQTIAFQVGTQTATGITDATGTATLQLAVSHALGSITAVASYAGTASQAAVSSNQLTVTIAAGPANALFTGSAFLWAPSATSKTGNLTLSATIQDLSADGCGDIRNATVSFGFRNPGGSITPIPGAQNLAVGLASPADKTSGVTSAIVTYNLAGYPASGQQIAITLGGSYTLASELDTTVIKPSTPGSANLLTILGGTVNLLASPAGLGFLDAKAGAVRSGAAGYMLVDAAAAWTKGLATPQGTAAIVVTTYNKADGTVDTNLHHYSIACTSIESLTDPASGSVQMTCKAQVQDVTNLFAPVTLDSAATLQLTATGGTSQGQVNVFAIGSNHNLWIAGGWSGTQSLNKPLVTGALIAN
jgi:hypothetical protein